MEGQGQLLNFLIFPIDFGRFSKKSRFSQFGPKFKNKAISHIKKIRAFRIWVWILKNAIFRTLLMGFWPLLVIICYFLVPGSIEITFFYQILCRTEIWEVIGKF